MYPHRAIEHDGPYGRECRICGEPLEGVGYTLRHLGEPVRTVEPLKADAKAFGKAVSVATAAAEADPEAGAAQTARAVVEALYKAGMLRRTPAIPKL